MRVPQSKGIGGEEPLRAILSPYKAGERRAPAGDRSAKAPVRSRPRRRPRRSKFLRCGDAGEGAFVQRRPGPEWRGTDDRVEVASIWPRLDFIRVPTLTPTLPQEAAEKTERAAAWATSGSSPRRPAHQAQQSLAPALGRPASTQQLRSVSAAPRVSVVEPERRGHFRSAWVRPPPAHQNERCVAHSSRGRSLLSRDGQRARIRLSRIFLHYAARARSFEPSTELLGQLHRVEGSNLGTVHDPLLA